MYKSKYFNIEEYKCPCCGLDTMSENALYMFDRIRESYGKPIIVTSGCRCKKHNKEVGGATNSAHLPSNGKCYAIDVKCNNSSDRHDLIKAIVKQGCVRYGVAKSFIHIDCNPYLDQGVVWMY